MIPLILTLDGAALIGARGIGVTGIGGIEVRGIGAGLPFLLPFTMPDQASLAGLSASQVDRIFAAGEWHWQRET